VPVPHGPDWSAQNSGSTLAVDCAPWSRGADSKASKSRVPRSSVTHRRPFRAWGHGSERREQDGVGPVRHCRRPEIFMAERVQRAPSDENVRCNLPGLPRTGIPGSAPLPRCGRRAAPPRRRALLGTEAVKLPRSPLLSSEIPFAVPWALSPRGSTPVSCLWKVRLLLRETVRLAAASPRRSAAYSAAAFWPPPSFVYSQRRSP
jgi:hypothetical protein